VFFWPISLARGMTVTMPPTAHATRPHRDETRAPRSVRWLAEDERAAFLAEAKRRGFLVVDVARIPPAVRTRLGDTIDAAIEGQLVAHGAPPPGIDASADAATALEDQLQRADSLKVRGICIALSSLGALVDEDGCLEPRDSRTLRFFARALLERPILLALDARDRDLPAFEEPSSLEAVLRGANLSTEAPPRSAPPLAEPPPTTEPRGAVVHAWPIWVQALRDAQGPQSLASFERLFVHHFVPLDAAIQSGLDDPRAIAAHAEFRRSFEHAYGEAFGTFAITGKRPRMVFDVPELATKVARLHGARTVHLVLVDSLRWEASDRLKEALLGKINGDATHVESQLLWSALPTTTPRQLELLARGPEALREPPGPHEEEPVRGRTSEIIRRVKIGARDLYRLDYLDARLRERDVTRPEELDAHIDACATILARHIQPLPARTLVYVFGDHGYTIDREGRIAQGGAHVEQVLVGGHAFLIGALH
jgi:hypothetical protein